MGTEPLNDVGWETEQFLRHRPHLEAVAYRMLGSVSEAEDAVQEAWLRLGRSQQDTIANARAWLTTIVARVCIDMLRARQSRHEDYVGAWVPEPLVEADDETDPERQLLMADAVGLALLVVLETLTPTERVAYVLHDMFAVPFSEIGEVTDRSPDAARQLASRARRRIRAGVPRSDADPAKQRELVRAFLAAARAGDFDALVAVLDPDVVLRAGGGPELQQELKGATTVARAMARSGPRFATLCHAATVNGQPGIVVTTDQGPAGAIGFTVSGGLISAIDVTVDPEAESLAFLRRRPGSAAEQIIGEALSWPGVQRAEAHLGAVALRLGRRELGHVHGDQLVDVPLPARLRDRYVKGGMSLQYEPEHSPGWVAVPLDTETGMGDALTLLRANYERAESRRSR
jgi:RNA polymerase sigma-70 factor, ECF subfamily